MKRAASRPVFAGLLCGFLVLCLNGCGSSSGQVTPPPPPPPPLAITTQSPLPQAVQGQPYSLKLQASGGVPPYTWSAQPLGIPGMALAVDGTLSGTPSSWGTYVPAIVVRDSKASAVSEVMQLDIRAPLAFMTPPALPDGNVGLPVNQYLVVSGGVQPYTFALAAGSSLPAGLTLSNSSSYAEIQGTPTVPGNYSFTVQASDSFSPPMQISQTFTLNVLNNLILPKNTLPDAVQSVPYLEQIQPAGGTPPYHFALVTNFVLPVGLLLDPATGVVSGTPSSPTTYPDWLQVTITDSAPTPASITKSVSIMVQPPLAFQTTSLPDGVRGLIYYNYNGEVYVQGGRAPYSMKVVSGALPDGLTLSQPYPGWPFAVSGTPTKNGSFSFTLQVSDSYETPNVASQSFVIRISDPLTITGPTLVQILYNQSYSTTFPVSGGIAPYTWSMNSIPAGFTFDPATGTLSGTPASDAPSSTYYSVSVHDSSNPAQSAFYPSFSLIVIGKLKILTSSLPTIATGSTNWLGIVIAGGGGPYQWTISPGTLPPGMALSTIRGNVTMTGSPTSAGPYTFTLNISDSYTGSLHQTTAQQLTLTVMDRAQMTRNDTIATATPVSNISLLASISPYSDPSAAGSDVDVYSATAAPGSIVQIYVSPNNDFLQPPEPNSLQPIIEIVDATGVRYQTCALWTDPNFASYNLPCVNGLPGPFYIQTRYYLFKVPGSGTAPVPFYVRVLDARGDARPDFIYTFGIFGVN